MAQISASQCTNLATAPGFYLRDDAAKAWDRAVTAYGKTVLLSGAWRSYETQVKLFDGEKFPNQTPQYGRYARGNRAGQRGFTTDVRGREADGSLYRGSWWTRKAGTAAAAVPGTSNHGNGLAVDVKTRRSKGDPAYPKAVVFTSFNDPDRLAFLKVAAAHGWYDTEGRSVGEHWHLTYYPERDKHRGEKPSASKPVKPAKPGKTRPKTPPTLSVGSKTTRNGWVGAIQWRVGADRDGVFGKGTEAAVKAFQRAQGLAADGVVGPRTWIAALYGKDAVAPGDKGTARVLLVQLLVGATADGVFGADTKVRVENVQRFLGVTPDGYVGRETRQALLKYLGAS